MSSVSDEASMIAFRFIVTYIAGHAASKLTTYFTSGLRIYKM